MNFFRTAFIAQICVFSLLQIGCGSEESGTPAQEQQDESAEASQGDQADTEPEQDQETQPDPEDETTPDDDTNAEDEIEPEDETEPESPWISEEDLSTMKVGDGYRLELESNATTGYQWALQPGMDESVLRLESSRYVNPEGADGMTGAGGTEVFIFRAQAVGSTNVLLHYAQPWMPDAFASDFSFEVNVVE